MAAWLWASVEVNTGDASVPDYATILFGVSSVCGAIILFLERVSCHSPPPLLVLTENLSVFLFPSYHESVQQPPVGICILRLVYFLFHSCLGGSEYILYQRNC